MSDGNRSYRDLLVKCCQDCPFLGLPATICCNRDAFDFVCSGGCGAMYEIKIESEEFKEKRTVQQHQMVNQVSGC